MPDLVLPRVARVVDAHGDGTAVSGPDGSLTYRELAGRADAVAGALRGCGVAAGDLVGLCVERSAALIVGALGIARAGAAFVAIDPAYPDERVRFMLADSGAVALVADPATDARLGATSALPAVVLGRGGVLPGGEPATALPAERGPDDVAYIVYTSGSTGEPKGVPVLHRSLANLVEWHLAAFDLTAGDRCTQIASPGFDAAVWEIWPALAAGAAIHIVPGALRGDPVALRDWLVDRDIAVTFLPTAVAEGMIGLAWPRTAALRYLLTGGDALGVRPAPGLPFTVINNYGLSETAVVATSGRVDPDGEGPPTIGRAIAGVALEVVDADEQPVPDGREGELVVGGVAVGPGYLNRPELTAQRFRPDGEVYRYRTGDRVRRRADGEIEFLGRVDDQLSIRGFRVEPGEVAAALNAHPEVETSVVVGTGDSSATRQLVAYVVAVDGDRPADADLSAFLGGVLPEYLVPSRYVWLDALPITAHGKVDRAALPAPAPSAPAMAEDPDAPIVARIVAMMAGLLEVPEAEVGPDENFFLLGGHSMLGAQLIVRLEQQFGVEIGLRHLFDHPTAAAIAIEVERQQAEGVPAP